MGVNGVKYLITPLFEDMDPTGRIFHTKADSKPSAGNPSSSKGLEHPSQSDIPTAPPMSSMPGMTPEVSSKPVDDALYHMVVTRIYVDNPYVVLYQNKVGLVYRALNLHEKDYPHDITLHVYGKKGLH